MRSRPPVGHHDDHRREHYLDSGVDLVDHDDRRIVQHDLDDQLDDERGLDQHDNQRTIVDDDERTGLHDVHQHHRLVDDHEHADDDLEQHLVVDDNQLDPDNDVDVNIDVDLDVNDDYYGGWTELRDDRVPEHGGVHDVVSLEPRVLQQQPERSADFPCQ